MQVYTIHVPMSTPNVLNPIDWVSAVRTRADFIFIDHNPLITTSRWTNKERMRKFIVTHWSTKHGMTRQLSAHATYERALLSALNWSNKLI